MRKFPITFPPARMIVVAGVVAWVLGEFSGGRTWLGNLLFHIPAAGLALALLAVAAFRRRDPGLATLCLALAALPILAVLLAIPPHRPRQTTGLIDPTTRAPYRVIHWNVGRGRLLGGWAPAVNTLLALEPDLLVLSETPRTRYLKALAEDLSARRQSSVGLLENGGLAVLAPGTLLEGTDHSTQQFDAWEVEWTPRAAVRPVSLLVFDLPANPLIQRDPVLRSVVRLIDTLGPDLVVGDFNAPRRSWALRHLPRGYRHCFDEAGHGLGLTWPVPLPLWAIDQCFAGPAVVIGDYQLRSSVASDHRLQLFEVTMGAGERRPRRR